MQPGAPNLFILSLIRDAPVCEVTWLWHKYLLLYRGNKNADGRMDGRSDGRQLLSCSLLRRNIKKSMHQDFFHISLPVKLNVYTNESGV